MEAGASEQQKVEAPICRFGRPSTTYNEPLQSVDKDTFFYRFIIYHSI